MSVESCVTGVQKPITSILQYPLRLLSHLTQIIHLPDIWKTSENLSQTEIFLILKSCELRIKLLEEINPRTERLYDICTLIKKVSVTELGYEANSYRR